MDNYIYASTGNQPTLSKYINFKKIASGYGYKNIAEVKTLDKLEQEIKIALQNEGPSLIHVHINNEGKTGKRVSDKYSCEQIKQRFMNKLNKKNKNNLEEKAK